MSNCLVRIEVFDSKIGFSVHGNGDFLAVALQNIFFCPGFEEKRLKGGMCSCCHYEAPPVHLLTSSLGLQAFGIAAWNWLNKQMTF